MFAMVNYLRIAPETGERGMRMKCKFCFAEFEEELIVCPACGKSQEETLEEDQPVAATEETSAAEEVAAEVTEEAPAVKEKKKPKTWQIVLAAACGVVLLAVLVGAVLYGLGVDFLPRKNDLYNKDSYTADNDKVEKKSDVVIATMGNQTLRVDDLQIYYWLRISDFLNAYGDYLSLMGLDATEPLDEQIYNPDTGMTFQQMFLQNAIADWVEFAAMVQLSEDNGFVLTQEDQEYLDSFETDMREMATNRGYEDLDAFVSENLAPGSTFDAFIKYNHQNYVGLTYYNSIYETMIPTTAEAEVYFAEHEDELVAQGYGKDVGSYYYVRHILLAPEGGSVGENGETIYTDEEWEACRAKAQNLLDEFLAGDATEEAFAQLAAEHSVDTGSSSNGGMYEGLTKETNVVTEFKDWYLAEGRQSGDTGLVKSVYGYHIMYFSSSEPIWEFETKATMLAENTDNMLKEVEEKWPVDIDYSKIVLGFINLSGYANNASY